MSQRRSSPAGPDKRGRPSGEHASGAQRSGQQALSARKINRGEAKSAHRWGLSAPVPSLNDTRSASSAWATKLADSRPDRPWEVGVELPYDDSVLGM